MKNTLTTKEACTITFGGIGAISPELYKITLQQVATLCNRTLDEQFKSEIIEHIKQLPCPLD